MKFGTGTFWFSEDESYLLEVLWLYLKCCHGGHIWDFEWNALTLLDGLLEEIFYHVIHSKTL